MNSFMLTVSEGVNRFWKT